MHDSSKEYLALQAWSHLHYGRTDDAIILLEGLAVLTPHDGWVRRTLAYACLQNGDFENCLQHLNRCLQSRNSRADRLLRIRALWGLERRDEARQLLKQLGGSLRDGNS